MVRVSLLPQIQELMLQVKFQYFEQNYFIFHTPQSSQTFTQFPLSILTSFYYGDNLFSTKCELIACRPQQRFVSPDQYYT